MIYLHVPFCRSFCTYCSFYSELACKGKDAAILEGPGSLPHRGKDAAILEGPDSLPHRGKVQVSFEEWADEVCREIASRREEIADTLDLNTLYIGGGTPSVLPLSILRRIVEALAEVSGCGPITSGCGPVSCGCGPVSCGQEPSSYVQGRPSDKNAPFSTGRYKEFTIEVNPEDIVEKGPEYVQGLLSLGVTRISMGVQSMDDGILRWMNRRHSAAGAREAYRILAAASPAEFSASSALSSDASAHSTNVALSAPGGPDSSGTSSEAESSATSGQQSKTETANSHIQISIDLITGVPGMSLEILNRTLDEVLEWRPSHISSYQLGIDEGSALAEMIESGKVQELSDEECRAQYELVCRRLREAGYHHYEISNWALPGCEAVHNSAYWTRHPYVGLGPGAHSLRVKALADAACGGAVGSPSGAIPDTACGGASIVAESDTSIHGANTIEIRSWNSQTLSGWTSSSEILTPEEIREERIMLGLRTDKGAEVEGRHIVIPEKDWFIADDIISDLI